LYDESHFVKLDDVAAKNQKLQQNGISEEVYCYCSRRREFDKKIWLAMLAVLNLGEGLPYGSEGSRKRLAKGLIKSFHFGGGILCCHLNKIARAERPFKKDFAFNRI